MNAIKAGLCIGVMSGCYAAAVTSSGGPGGVILIIVASLPAFMLVRMGAKLDAAEHRQKVVDSF